MKKMPTLLFAVTMLAGFSSVAMAQSTDNETISANANVVSSVVVGEEFNNLELGSLFTNSTKFLDAATGSVDITKGTRDALNGGEERGYFSIQIIQGTSLDLTLDTPRPLSGSGSETLPVTFFKNGMGSKTDFPNAVITDSKPSPSVDLSSDIVSGGADSDFSLITDDPDKVTWENNGFNMPANDVYLVIGGQVAAGENQAIDTYTGTITLTATVTN